MGEPEKYGAFLVIDGGDRVVLVPRILADRRQGYDDLRASQESIDQR